MDQYTAPDLAHSALITIDTQNDFTLPNAPALIPGTLDVIPNIVRLINIYRDRHLPIIHVIRLYLPDGSNVDLCRRQLIESGRQIVAPGTDGAELVAALKPRAGIRLDAHDLLAGNFQSVSENEHIMYKPRWGAFYNTQLNEFLQQRDINTLVFSGCNYPNCPRTSIYEASERDYRIILAQDAMSQLDTKSEQELKNIAVDSETVDELVSMFGR